MSGIDIKDRDQLAGAVYFAVGMGTEGGSASYHLSVAGVTKADWGKVNRVAANSGYTLGAIQIDFGQRGTWPVGEIEGRKLRPGEKTYVDAVIEQAAGYARKNGLPFASDLTQLRSDLLSHGNGLGGRTSIHFIDAETRNSITAWASSAEGKRWVHHNMDLPQVRNATDTAVAIIEKYGAKIESDRKFEAVCLLAKTANQFPGKLEDLEGVLKRGGGYSELLSHAESIHQRREWFHGPKAAAIGEKYENLYAQDAIRVRMEAAHAKVVRADFDPASMAVDTDIAVSLSAVGSRPQRSPMADGMLKQGERGPEVAALQVKLISLGMTDAQGNALIPDDSFGARTKQAVEKFQREVGLSPTGVADGATLRAIDSRVDPLQGIKEVSERIGQMSKLAAAEENLRPQLIDGMPDYLLPNRSSASKKAMSAPITDDARPAFADGRFNVGDEGIGVERLQMRLKSLDYPGRNGGELVVDSDFGPSTQHAVRAFQTAHGLASTGEADINTLRAIETAVEKGERYVPPPMPQSVVVDDVREKEMRQPDAAQPHERGIDLYTPQEREAYAQALHTANLEGVPQGESHEVARLATVAVSVLAAEASRDEPQQLRVEPSSIAMVGPAAHALIAPERSTATAEPMTRDRDEAVSVDRVPEQRTQEVVQPSPELYPKEVRRNVPQPEGDEQDATASPLSQAKPEPAVRDEVPAVAQRSDERPSPPAEFPDGKQIERQQAQDVQVIALERPAPIDPARESVSGDVRRREPELDRYDDVRAEVVATSRPEQLRSAVDTPDAIRLEPSPSRTAGSEDNARGTAAHRLDTGSPRQPDGREDNSSQSAVDRSQQTQQETPQTSAVLAAPAMPSAKKAGRDEDEQEPQAVIRENHAQLPLMTEPAHPAHHLYLQAHSQITRVEAAPGMGLTQHEKQTLGASAVAEALSAKGWNFTGIDHVVPSNRIEPQTGRPEAVFVVQGELNDPAHRRIAVNMEQALSQTIEQSSTVAQTVQQTRQQTMELEQSRAEAMDMDGPKGPVMRMGGRSMSPPGDSSDSGGDG